ncbi:MAG: FtsX-like permease family protein [Candidatus Thorarchaeota archaeon]
MLISRIVDLIDITFTFFYSNRKSIIATSLGLIVALAAISQTTLYLDSIKGQLFVQTMNGQGYKDHYDFGIKEEKLTPSKGQNFPTDLISYQYQIIGKALELANISSYYDTSYWWLESQIRAYVNGTIPIGKSDLPKSRIIDYNGFNNTLFTTLLPYMAPGSEIPTTSHEGIIFVPLGATSDFGLHIGQNLTLQSFDQTPNSPGYNTSLIVTGLLYIDEKDENNNLTSLFNGLTGSKNTIDPTWFDFMVFASYNSWIDTMTDIVDNTNGFHNRYYYIDGRIFLDRTKIDIFNLEAELGKLNIFFSSLKDEYSIYSPSLTTLVDDFLVAAFKAIKFELYGLLTFLVMFSLPIIALALFLVIYSSGIIHRQKKRVVTLIRIRGLSSIQVFFVLFSETLLSLLGALISAILLGIPMSILSLKTDGIFSFDGPGYPLVIDWVTLIELVFTLGFVFSFLLNLRSIINFSKIDPAEVEDPFEHQVQYWKAKYLDLVFTIIGIIGFAILFIGTQTSDLPGETYTIVYILGIPSPFFLMIGITLLVSRIFPKIFSFVSTFLWRVQGGVLAFSWKNMVRNNESALRSVILLMLAFTFAIVAVTIPPSLENYYLDDSFYTVGADLYFNVPNFLGSNQSQSLVESNAHLVGITPVIDQDRYANQGGHKLLAIDPNNYANIATDRGYYQLSDSIPHLMDKLKNDNSSIIVRKADLDRLGKDIGDYILFASYKYNFTKGETEIAGRLNLKVVGYFSYWPRLVDQTPAMSKTSNDIYLVGDLELASEFSKILGSTTDNYGYLGRVDTQQDTSNVANTINTFLGKNATITSMSSYQSKITNPTWITSLGILNSNSIVIVLITIVFQLLFVYMFLSERRQEIAVQRSIGMSLSQTFRAFFYEGLAIITFGIVLGLFLGSLLSIIFMFIALLQDLVPPFSMIYPVLSYVFIALILFITTIIMSLIAAVIISKGKLNSVLRGD